ncbi:SIMPL domain-containing protein [Plebeiibacterium marinum]|uniref:SIMPL domain-containing protein n=1 Tax=Plebeiibacterium marinum TaxID=2992111 RepID=A0AAE3MG51_9BACT|nr:SIMPL domain-containing protein [Plebeiobacterium marinum]MCW3807012.1 SIMPL domain-containing protein [Plebeiobacterium marinum]
MKTLILTLAVMITTATFAQQGQKNFIDHPYIEVTGKAEMQVQPDMIYIKVDIDEKDTKNKISLEELERKMINQLEKIGVDIKNDVKLKDISSNFKYYFLQKKDIVLSKEYQVLVKNGQTAGRVFLELEKIGISNISIEKVDHSEIEDLRNEVKINAIKAAKEKAGHLAKAINQSAGKAIFIQEQNYMLYRPAVSNAFYMKGDASSLDMEKAKVPEIEFEKIKLEYSILCRFDLM